MLLCDFVAAMPPAPESSAEGDCPAVSDNEDEDVDISVEEGCCSACLQRFGDQDKDWETHRQRRKQYRMTLFQFYWTLTLTLI